MAKLKFQMVTPERKLFNEEVDSLTCPTTTGQITVLPGHIPLISSLETGELVAKTGANEQYIFVSGGFVEVRPGGEVIVLADSAEFVHEIDLEAAEKAKLRAQQSMREQEHASAEEYAGLAAQIRRSTVRLNIARKHLHRQRPFNSENLSEQ